MLHIPVEKESIQNRARMTSAQPGAWMSQEQPASAGKASCSQRLVKAGGERRMEPVN